jgi:hypothetical protein
VLVRVGWYRVEETAEELEEKAPSPNRHALGVELSFHQFWWKAFSD